MPGFSRTDQARLALLVRAQRGALSKVPQFASDEAYALSRVDQALVWLLRQCVILCRNRAESNLPEVQAEITSRGYRLRLPSGWLASNPLSKRALEEEAAYWSAVGVRCQYG